MTLKLPPKVPKLLEKVIRFRALQWKDGKLFLFNVPGVLSQVYVIAYQQRLLENQVGIKRASNILYNGGKFQARQGAKLFNKRFGYAHTFIDKKKLLYFNLEQSSLTGFGGLKWIRLDFDKNIFIMTGKSALAEEYLRFFGLQKNSVDHWIRGCAAAMIGEVVTKDKKMLCIETKCLAKGNPYCEFIIKPIENWDKKDPLVKAQLTEDLQDIKKLGAKMEPYTFIQ
jgi:hypothetical protein